ncbi:MAG: hypothetical protein JWL70_2659, partial [Acidimicrobiia bacterium]|nr:hypothetical protein [Acidimicrobiia bacterium]
GVNRLLASRQLIRVHASVFISAAHPRTMEAELVAACMAHDAAVVSHTAAGRQWGLRRMGMVVPYVTVPHGRGPKLAGVTVHRSRVLEPEDVVTRGDGIRLTSPPRTVFDLASMLDDGALASVIEQVIDQYCSYGSLVRVLDRLGAGGRPGTARFARVLGSRPADRRASDSEPELRLAEALRAVGLRCEPQYPVTLPGGVTIHIDLALIRERVAVEVDHSHWHGVASAAHRDKERDRLLGRGGWHPVRVTEIDVV